MMVCIGDIRGRAAVADGLAAVKNHAAFIWSVADPPRGYRRQFAYRKAILPLTAVRVMTACQPKPGRARLVYD